MADDNNGDWTPNNIQPAQPQYGQQGEGDPQSAQAAANPAGGTPEAQSAPQSAQETQSAPQPIQQAQSAPQPQYGEQSTQTLPPLNQPASVAQSESAQPASVQSESAQPAATQTLPTAPQPQYGQTYQQPQSAAAQSAAAQPTQVAPQTDDTPNYAAAAGEKTVVSSAPTQPQSQPAQPTAQPQPQPQPLYRPAPEYGAYGPVPTQPQTDQNAQPGAQQNGGASNGGTAQPQYGQYNPFGSAQGTPQNQQNQQGGGAQFPPFGPFSDNGGAPANGDAGNVGVAAKTGRRTASGVVIAVVAALVSAALCLGVGYAALTMGWVTIPVASSNSLTNVSSNKSGNGTATAKSGESTDWQAVAKEVSDSVVSIQTQLSNGTAKGSGAIVDAKGYIVTNNHVISGAQQIQVTLSNGQIYSAKVVGTDTTTDLAVIKLDNPPSDLKAVTFADSDQLAVGEGVMAIGNPLGYDDTATTGIVSALNRPVTVMDDNNN
ncbi:S1C family serine protease, partial [Bifidobacterium jacchi]|uniref:S1C family serine protease n=1 Tax=Bifidobacterium jacchi TaxID=2490545 RepID=UPI001F502083